jgi:hypothetical protein
VRPIPAGARRVSRTFEYEQVWFDNFTTTTDKDTPIIVGVGEPQGRVPAFWCHAHASLSFHLFGYCVTGESLLKILADEYEEVDKKPRCGDIVVWEEEVTEDGKKRKKIVHSARVESATHHRGSATTDIVVSNKPGLGVGLQRNIPIKDAIPGNRKPSDTKKEGVWTRKGKYFRKKGVDPLYTMPIEALLALVQATNAMAPGRARARPRR